MTRPGPRPLRTGPLPEPEFFSQACIDRTGWHEPPQLAQDARRAERSIAIPTTRWDLNRRTILADTMSSSGGEFNRS